VSRASGQPPGRADGEPPVLWTWAADDLNGRGVRGVTDVPGRAQQELLAALRTMPNRGHGTIRQAELDICAYPYPAYRYGPILVRAHRDENTGEIVLQPGGGS
jgi:hypothetical protein